LPRAIVVSAGPGIALEQCPSGAVASTLHFFDPESMMETRTATAPGCLTRLAADPLREGGFIGVFARGDLLELARFDDAGRIDPASEVLADPRSPDTIGPNDAHLLRAHCDRPIALMMRSDRWVLMLDGTTGPSDCSVSSSAMFTYDAASLRALDRFAYPGQ